MLCHETQIPGFHHDNPYELLEAMKEKRISLLQLQEDNRAGGLSHCQSNFNCSSRLIVDI
jgi:hypothetical protein